MSEFDKYRETLPLHQMIVSANCCRHAFEYRQAKIDELQEANLNLEGECVQLQKRLDAVKAIMNEYYTGSYEESAEMAGLISAALEGDHAH